VIVKPVTGRNVTRRTTVITTNRTITVRPKATTVNRTVIVRPEKTTINQTRVITRNKTIIVIPAAGNQTISTRKLNKTVIVKPGVSVTRTNRTTIVRRKRVVVT